MVQTISTKLTDQMTAHIDALVASGLFVSRSEALREAVRYLWFAQQGSLKAFAKKEQLTERDKARIFKEYAKEKGWKL